MLPLCSLPNERRKENQNIYIPIYIYSFRFTGEIAAFIIRASIFIFWDVEGEHRGKQMENSIWMDEIDEKKSLGVEKSQSYN